MKVPLGTMRAPYLAPHTVVKGRECDANGNRLCFSPTLHVPRRGHPGDKLRRKGLERKL